MVTGLNFTFLAALITCRQEYIEYAGAIVSDYVYFGNNNLFRHVRKLFEIANGYVYHIENILFLILNNK